METASSTTVNSTEATTLNIYQKLLEIQKRVIGLGKDKKSFGYDYVTGTKVLEHIKPHMNSLGLLLKQEVLSIENTRQDYNTKQGAKSEIHTKAMMRFTWIDCETGEKDENLFGANGQNDFEKGFGSACTYAERIFLLKFFHIATDEDDIDNPDRKTSDPVKAKAESTAASETATEKLASKEQKAAIIKLLNNPAITNDEKNKMLVTLDKMNEKRANEVINKLGKTINEREGK